MVIESRMRIDPTLMHRVAVIGLGTLDVLRTTARWQACFQSEGWPAAELSGSRPGRHVTELLGVVAVIALAGLLGAFESARAAI
ncbi:hypothetical protein [Bradyrhizobium iriomotense]|uniref:Uncharacterized protein n=1 Tax=Bradyrhizobium iriomotense TaxID=441950 RepID=A0ABQ6BDY1_9BRAD|nr:hypothetical protein [Bradyrhizobium iriomotense]GLR91120.1 hypothetical protein GCM10007857_78360 [Bradyrhizobium iriomotense]